MKSLFSLTGKVAAVTGAAGVLCSSMSTYLAEQGVKVALLDRNAEMAEKFAAQIREQGGDAIALACDVLSKESMSACRDAILQKYGQVDVLVNGAGGNHPKASVSADMSFFDIPEDALRFVFDLNFIGTLLPTQVFGIHMMERGSGSIVNMSSMSAFRPLTNVIAYSAAKAAVSNLTGFMATYFARNGAPNVRVNAIAPGFFITEQNRYLLTSRETGEYSPRGKHVIQQTPMGRFGTPEELLGALHYLISDSASFVTGVVLPVDGGFNVFAI